MITPCGARPASRSATSGRPTPAYSAPWLASSGNTFENLYSASLFFLQRGGGRITSGGGGGGGGVAGGCGGAAASAAGTGAGGGNRGTGGRARARTARRPASNQPPGAPHQVARTSASRSIAMQRASLRATGLTRTYTCSRPFLTASSSPNSFLRGGGGGGGLGGAGAAQQQRARWHRTRCAPGPRAAPRPPRRTAAAAPTAARARRRRPRLPRRPSHRSPPARGPFWGPPASRLTTRALAPPARSVSYNSEPNFEMQSSRGDPLVPRCATCPPPSPPPCAAGAVCRQMAARAWRGSGRTALRRPPTCAGYTHRAGAPTEGGGGGRSSATPHRHGPRRRLPPPSRSSTSMQKLSACCAHAPRASAVHTSTKAASQASSSSQDLAAGRRGAGGGGRGAGGGGWGVGGRWGGGGLSHRRACRAARRTAGAAAAWPRAQHRTRTPHLRRQGRASAATPARGSGAPRAARTSTWQGHGGIKG
jgi:hypothetical protein